MNLDTTRRTPSEPDLSMTEAECDNTTWASFRKLGELKILRDGEQLRAHGELKDEAARATDSPPGCLFLPCLLHLHLYLLSIQIFLQNIKKWGVAEDCCTALYAHTHTHTEQKRWCLCSRQFSDISVCFNVTQKCKIFTSEQRNQRSFLKRQRFSSLWVFAEWFQPSDYWIRSSYLARSASCMRTAVVTESLRRLFQVRLPLSHLHQQ